MAGIVFFRTDSRTDVCAFYTERLDFEEWLEQDGGCTILERDNLLLGFCDGDTTETEGIVTVVVDDRDAVDTLFEELEDVAADEPHENEAFDIYQFFATDPDGRTVEIQTFLHSTPPV
ncbi:VOC family protein [Halobacteriaceae bacterium SHR40]|uniref:VOC family protein n=1 Tax=Halovenus amylolytica TaxID=2500550 RepID=UPI000FE3F4A5